MAHNRNPYRGQQWRDAINTSLLVKRLYDNSIGKIELTASQLKSIEILLRKTIPDLKAIEHSGETKQTTIVIQEYREPKE